MRRGALLAGIAILTASLSWGQTSSVPSLVNYQGKLVDATGEGLNGMRNLEFNVYDAPADGSNVWGRQAFTNVAVVGGQFNVILGTTDVHGRSIADAFGGDGRYIGIKVNDGTELVPRQQILSAPFALQALKATKATDQSNIVPTGSVMAFAGVNAPGGWLLCDGRPVSSQQYALLHGAIGTAWGNGTDDGDPNTDFNLPDLRGAFLRGVDGAAGRDPAADARTAPKAGANTGNQVGSYQAESDLTHAHTFTLGGHSGGDSGAAKFTGLSVIHPNSVVSDVHPKNMYVNYIIKY